MSNNINLLLQIYEPARSEIIPSLPVEHLVNVTVLSDSEAAGAERWQLQLHSEMREDEAARPGELSHKP